MPNMSISPLWLRLLAVFSLALLFLVGCAGYDGRGLQPGVATVDEVIAVMGEPALRWREADGSEQLAYPRGPAGPHTYMVWLGPDGRLIRIENVLQMSYFARIVPGQDDYQSIQRLLGPPNPAWTAYFSARDEMAWEWMFCDDWSRQARFDVLFDATSHVVRSTMQRQESSRPPYCGH